MFTKVDLKDGYWRMVVNANDAWNLVYVLPPVNPGDAMEVVIPDSLQMGWGESPPFFCAATETARDIADNVPLLTHPMEDIMINIDWDDIPAPNNISRDTIKKIFLVYIHEQIAVFSKNVSTKMSRPLEFHNIQFQRITAPTVYSHAPVA